MTTSVNITAFRRAILDLQSSTIPSHISFEAGKVFARELGAMDPSVIENLLTIDKEEKLSASVLKSLDPGMLFHKWGMVEATDNSSKNYGITSKGKLVVKFVLDAKQLLETA